MITYKQIKDVGTAMYAGAVAGAAGAFGIAVKFFHFQIMSLSSWTPRFLLILTVSAVAFSVLLGVVAWKTRQEDVTHERGTRIEKS